jgi:transcription factor SPN1
MSDQYEDSLPGEGSSDDENSVVGNKAQESESNTEEDEQPEMINALMNKKRRPKIPRYIVDEEEDENMIDQLLDSMNKAAENDIQANRDGAPALNKLKMLDKILKFLKVTKHHELFLGMNGCVVLGRWLSQLPDGSFPSTPLRSGLLQAIQDLPITVDNLQGSDLGKSVMGIYSNPNEAQAIKKHAKMLIDKWSRMIYDINTEYTALHKESNGVETVSMPKKKFNLQSLISQEQQTNYTKLPERGMFNFKNRPISEIITNENSQMYSADSTYAKLKKKMLKKKGRSKSKGMMSVDGKGLDY